MGSIPESGRSPGVGNGNPLQYSWPRKFHGQSILEGYSPWGHKESDRTEHTHTHFIDEETKAQRCWATFPGWYNQRTRTWTQAVWPQRPQFATHSCEILTVLRTLKKTSIHPSRDSWSSESLTGTQSILFLLVFIQVDPRSILVLCETSNKGNTGRHWGSQLHAGIGSSQTPYEVFWIFIQHLFPICSKPRSYRVP